MMTSFLSFWQRHWRRQGKRPQSVPFVLVGIHIIFDDCNFNWFPSVFDKENAQLKQQLILAQQQIASLQGKQACEKVPAQPIHSHPVATPCRAAQTPQVPSPKTSSGSDGKSVPETPSPPNRFEKKDAKEMCMYVSLCRYLQQTPIYQQYIYIYCILETFIDPAHRIYLCRALKPEWDASAKGKRMDGYRYRNGCIWNGVTQKPGKRWQTGSWLLVWTRMGVRVMFCCHFCSMINTCMWRRNSWPNRRWSTKRKCPGVGLFRKDGIQKRKWQKHSSGNRLSAISNMWYTYNI